MPRVTVVIATYNRNERLQRCLEGVLSQTFRDFEVVVVDDRSDPPVDFRTMVPCTRSITIHLVRATSNGGPARARNLGVAASTSEFLAFLDDDVVPDPSWLAKHVGFAEGTEQQLVQFGPLAAPPEWLPTPWNLWEAHTLELEYDRMRRGVYEPTWRQFFTGNAFLRRSLFTTVGGFDERFTRAEDIELGYRLERAGARFAFVSGAVGWHFAERSLESWLAIPRDYARFDVVMDQIHPEMNWIRFVESQQRRRHRLARFGGFVLGSLGAESAGVRCSVNLARLTHGRGIRFLTVSLLSFAYGVEYRRALRNALGGVSRNEGFAHGPNGPASN